MVNIMMEHEVQQRAGFLYSGICGMIVIMGDSHCMELIVAVGMTVTVVMMAVIVLMDVLVGMGYTVMRMLMAVGMGMLMAVFAVEMFVHSCLLFR